MSKTKQYPLELRQRARALRAAGWSYVAIARHLGISGSLPSKWLSPPGTTNRVYPRAVREQALALLAQGQTAVAVAHHLGLRVDTVYCWKSRALPSELTPPRPVVRDARDHEWPVITGWAARA